LIHILRPIDRESVARRARLGRTGGCEPPIATTTDMDRGVGTHQSHSAANLVLPGADTLSRGRTSPPAARDVIRLRDSTKTGPGGLLGEILKQLHIERMVGDEYTCWCPIHHDGAGEEPHAPNLSVSVRGYCCHACGAQGSLIELAQELKIAPEAVYSYRDAQGAEKYQVVRWPGKEFRQRQPDGHGGYVDNIKGVDRLPYRLPELLEEPDEVVFVTEGEMDADRLAAAGLIATTNSGGANKLGDNLASYIAGGDMVLLPDNDEPGRKHMQQVAHLLRGEARSIKIIELPDLPRKGDVSDWLDAGHTCDELLELVRDAPEYVPGTDDAPVASTDREGKASAQRLFDLAVATGAVPFHDQLGREYIRVPGLSTRSTLSLDSRDAEMWLRSISEPSVGATIRKETVRGALDALTARAWSAGEYRLHNRCARHDGAIWVDLDGRRAARVTSEGWQVIEDPPILFRTFAHHRPLPMPARGGRIKDVFPFVNLQNGTAKVLFASYLGCAFVPDIAMPMLVVHGTQGTAKTTLLKVLKRLIDPDTVEVSGQLGDLGELARAASQNRVLFYDNLSSMTAATSDALCRIVTGEGFTRRALYTDDTDYAAGCQAMLGVSSITQVSERSDLLDRSLILGLSPILPGDRRPESAFWEAFEAARPGILAGMLDTLASMMEIEPRLGITPLPRMADYARWGEAAAQAVGAPPNRFLKAYQDNVDQQNQTALDADPVAQAILALMTNKPQWEGNASQLLLSLRISAREQNIDTERRSWPRDGSGLSKRIRAIEPNLASVGIDVAYLQRTSGTRPLRLTRVGGVARDPRPGPTRRAIVGRGGDCDDGSDNSDGDDTSDGNDASDRDDSASVSVRPAVVVPSLLWGR
jgi:hypothetical protein